MSRGEGQGKPRKRPRPKTGGVPNSRTYFHKRCREATTVSDNDFTHITHPFIRCTGTYCCTCRKHDSLTEFTWVETGETIKEYRRRMRAESPPFLKFWGYGGGALVCGCICGILGAVMGTFGVMFNSWGQGAAIFGGVGAIMVSSFLMETITYFCGVDYRRIL